MGSGVDRVVAKNDALASSSSSTLADILIRISIDAVTRLA